MLFKIRWHFRTATVASIRRSWHKSTKVHRSRPVKRCCASACRGISRPVDDLKGGSRRSREPGTRWLNNFTIPICNTLDELLVVLMKSRDERNGRSRLSWHVRVNTGAHTRPSFVYPSAGLAARCACVRARDKGIPVKEMKNEPASVITVPTARASPLEERRWIESSGIAVGWKSISSLHYMRG
jgi:hypothetical protein